MQVYINSAQNVVLANVNWRLDPFFFDRKRREKRISFIYFFSYHSFLLSFTIIRADCVVYHSFRTERYWSGSSGKPRETRTITLPIESAPTAT